MWTLVYIIFINGELNSHVGETYDSMYQCFEAREALSYDAGGQEGYFPPDSQAICVLRGGDDA